MPSLSLSPRHLERLRAIARSAGWPCRDAIELDLLAAGMVRRAVDTDGRETLQIVDRTAPALAAELATEVCQPDLREAVAQALVTRLQREGHVVWRDLALGGVVCDVYGVRRTSVEAYLHPVAYLLRTGLLAPGAPVLDADAATACMGASSRSWCVLGPDLAWDGDRDIPRPWGVLRARFGAASSGRIELAVERPAASRALRLPVRHWMSLARSAPVSASASTARAAQAFLVAAPSDAVDVPIK